MASSYSLISPVVCDMNGRDDLVWLLNHLAPELDTDDLTIEGMEHILALLGIEIIRSDDEEQSS